MKPKVIIETKFDTETNRHEYRARLDANYFFSVNPEEVLGAVHDLQPMIEAELRAGLSKAVYGDIVKEMRQVIEACSKLKSVQTKEYSDFILLKDQIKNLENCTNNIMNLCIIE